MDKSINIFNILIIVVSLVIDFTSCSHQSHKDLSQFDALEGEKLQTRVLNDTFEFGSANKILVYDTLLIIFDDLNPNKLQFFHKENGSHLWEFGRIGQGDKELISPSGLTLNLSADIMSVYDYAKRSLLACKLEDLGKFNSENWFEIHIPDYQIIPKEVLPVGENGYLSIHGKPRMIYSNDNIKFEYDIYPTLLDDESKRMFMLSESLLNISPDGEKFVQATTLGVVMDFFELTEDEIIPVTENCFKKPVFEMQKGQICVLPESVYGFSCLSSTNNDLYATLHGKEKPTEYPSEIYQFDWDGVLRKKWETGRQIVAFGVDVSTEEIYAIYMNEANDQILVKFVKS